MELTRVFLALAFTVNTVRCAGRPKPERDPPIVFKRVTTYDWIYNDHDTGADRDVSIWRPKNNENGYYPVGDTAVASHDPPTTSAVMVKEVKPRSLAPPVGFTEIWDDRGSGGSHDVRIMRMDPPRGFTCIGHVAILGYGSTPNANQYRCVKNSYITRGVYEQIWNDRGSGAHRDVGLWGNRISPENTYGIDANTFTATADHFIPGGFPSLLDGHHVKNHQLVAPVMGSYVFTLFEGTDLEEIWNDRGSGARHDFSVWRSQRRSNAYSLGDIAVTSHGRPPHSYVVKAHRDDALRQPYGFRQVWNDRGSGADWDVSFWLPQCPPGYRGLGHAATRNHHREPPRDRFRCVKAEYTKGGRWEWVWNDGGSGANRDVAVWKAVAQGDGQGVEAMSAIAHHGHMNVGAYVLIPGLVNYVRGKPASKYILSNVNYFFDDRNVLQTEPDTLSRTIVENRGDTEQTSTRTVEYTYEESYSWSHSLGLEIGVTTSVEAGIPLVTSGSTSITVTTSYSHEWGKSTTKSYTDSISVEITVKPNSHKSAIITGSRYTADIPYEATLIIEYPDDTRETRERFRGVYQGVQINEVRVTYEADIPLESTVSTMKPTTLKPTTIKPTTLKPTTIKPTTVVAFAPVEPEEEKPESIDPGLVEPGYSVWGDDSVLPFIPYNPGPWHPYDPFDDFWPFFKK